VDEADAEEHPGRMPGRYVQVQVSDSGTGMDEATLAHAFEPFFTTKPVGHGTGMGLAAVYGIVKQLNGHVSIHSVVGHGTTVTVLIPATTQVAAVQAPVTPAVLLRPASGTVLVVEDYADLRELFQEILSGAGYRVLTAGDGNEALTVARAHAGTIDLLLTDIVMPNLLGTDLARELRAARPTLRVLFMSGHAQPVIGGASPLPPGETLLQKPFMEAELLEKLAEVLAAPVRNPVAV
jgi:two-component system cell cycle sensor histidine kinase/response regulator CckA